MILVALDAVLLAGLLGLALGAVTLPGLFRSVVLYVAFGLVLGLAWVRLGVPDIALAEIALAAGVTGALLMITLRDGGEVELERPWEDDHAPDEDLG